MIGSVPGPKDTPYEGGVFRVDIQLDAQYPFAPPKMRFMTRVWHPNVSSANGAICLGEALRAGRLRGCKGPGGPTSVCWAEGVHRSGAQLSHSPHRDGMSPRRLHRTQWRRTAGCGRRRCFKPFAAYSEPWPPLCAPGVRPCAHNTTSAFRTVGTPPLTLLAAATIAAVAAAVAAAAATAAAAQTS